MRVTHKYLVALLIAFTLAHALNTEILLHRISHHDLLAHITLLVFEGLLETFSSAHKFVNFALLRGLLHLLDSFTRRRVLAKHCSFPSL